MNSSKLIKVVTRDGAHGVIDASDWPPSGSQADVMVQFHDGTRAMVPRSNLSLEADAEHARTEPPGPEHPGMASPVTGARRSEDASTVAQGQPGEALSEGQVVIPVVEERVEVGKRVVESGGVRVTRRTEEEQRVIEQALRQEAVEIERVPVNRVVDSPQPVRQEGDTTIVPIVEEVLVIQKQLVLREELHVRKRVREVVHPRTVSVRKQSVEVERLESPDNRGEEGTDVAAAD